MKKLLLSLVCLVSLSAVAQQVTTVDMSGLSRSSVLVGSGSLLSLQLIGGTNATTVTFYDNSVNGITNVTAQYTIPYTFSSVNVSNYITLGGITNNYTNTVILTTNKVVAAATNTLPALASFYVPASTVVTVSDPQVTFAKGLVLSTGNVTNSLQALLVYSLWR